MSSTTILAERTSYHYLVDGLQIIEVPIQVKSEQVTFNKLPYSKILTGYSRMSISVCGFVDSASLLAWALKKRLLLCYCKSRLPDYSW